MLHAQTLNVHVLTQHSVVYTWGLGVGGVRGVGGSGGDKGKEEERVASHA